MKLHTHWLRVLHRWIGLLIGVQILLWTVSGAVMAFLPMDEVEGGEMQAAAPVALPGRDAWPAVRRQLGATPVTGVRLQPLLDRQMLEVSTTEGARLFDAATGHSVTIDGLFARKIAAAAYGGEARVKAVTQLDELTLPVREHALPIWRVDFQDQKNSSFYVSGSTGQVLERRNDSWRLWDFFWMLHIMDYGNRTSFNHPLIIMTGFAAVWLAITGVYLLLRTGWRTDFKRILARRR